MVDASTMAMVNGIARHSDQLMGITAYGHPNFSEVATQQLVRELDIRSIGIQAIVTNFAPPNLTLSASAPRRWFTKDNANGPSPALRYITQHQPSLVEPVASHGISTAGALELVVHSALCSPAVFACCTWILA